MRMVRVPVRSILKLDAIKGFLNNKWEYEPFDRELSRILERDNDNDSGHMFTYNLRSFCEYLSKNDLCYQGAMFELGKVQAPEFNYEYLKGGAVVGSEAHLKWASNELAEIEQDVQKEMDYFRDRIKEITNGLPTKELPSAGKLLARIDTFSK